MDPGSEASRDAIAFVPVGPARLRGRSQALEVFELRRGPA